MNQKLKDAVYGFAVGDALGVPYEFKQRDTFKCTGMIGFGTWNQPPGTWSDDTSMVLATCNSIRLHGCIILDDIRYRFLRWYRDAAYTAHGEVFDIGGTTAKALLSLKGCDDEWSNGNGSLMRILPLAFAKNCSEKDVFDVSGLTHAHEISKEKCWEYVTCAKVLLNGGEVPVAFKDVPREHIKSTGYVVDSFEAALWCVANTDNYRECVLTAVNLGGDTDTIAALAGGLAGIKYGYEAIPKEWIDQLANKELIDHCMF